MQSQQQSHPRPDSPSDNGSHAIMHHIQSQDPTFSLRPLQNGLFTQGNPVNHVQPAVDYPDGLVDPQKQKINGFNNSMHRSNFTSIPNANRGSRHHPPSSTNPALYRDTPTSTSAFYPSSDMYQPAITSPTQTHMQTFDARASYDFGPGAAPAPPSGTNHKAPYSIAEPYATNSLPNNFPMGAKPQQQQQHVNGYVGSGSSSFVMASQTPYGPHLATNPVNIGGGGNSMGNVPSGVNGGVNGVGVAPNGNRTLEEDISTIFVVGFPEDMQEREFQNMFTFSPGFEAATLKIPNKEYTSYGSLASAGAGSSAAGNHRGVGYSGSNDPYNLVTVNQGGVVVDGGRDGTMSSWPAMMDDAAPGTAGGNHFYGGAGMQAGAGGGAGGPGGSMPPRKQIIGFAKFRTRDEALHARDVLQGRRVDIEKGAVLKAEMAKKNLHTKRGVGPVVGGAVAGGANVPGAGAGGIGALGAAVQGLIGGGGGNHASLQSFQLGGPDGYPMPGNDVMGARDREMAALGAMGLAAAPGGRLWPQENGSHLNGVREDEERRRDGVINAMGLAHGARAARVLEEEEQKERKRQNKDALRLRAGSAYDAFHSIPAQAGSLPTPTSSAPQPGIISVPPGLMENGLAQNHNHHSGMIQHPVPTEENTPVVGPWDYVQRTAPNRPPSSSRRSSSPPHPSSHSTSSNAHSEGRSSSPSKDQCSQPQSGSDSPSSSVNGHAQGRPALPVDEVVRAVGNLAVSTNHGNSSPELPSPESGASSGGSTRNGVDQNPPINTLYVGNLPISPPPPNYPQDILEESLRELFRSRPGFRRLSFKQKSSGPMCFVEFEDVSAASKTINELYGHTLNGLVKGGGIRLSYSKNPLGVRTPTSATGPGAALQQQQQQGPGHAPPPGSFANQAMSPAPTQTYMMSPPPPRFSTTSLGSYPSTASNNAFLFGANNMNNSSGFRLASSDLPSSMPFSPFDLGGGGVHRNIPDQNSSDPRHIEQHQQHFIPRALSPNAHNVEVARAG